MAKREKQVFVWANWQEGRKKRWTIGGGIRGGGEEAFSNKRFWSEKKKLGTIQPFMVDSAWRGGVETLKACTSSRKYRSQDTLSRRKVWKDAEGISLKTVKGNQKGRGGGGKGNSNRRRHVWPQLLAEEGPEGVCRPLGAKKDKI